MSSVAPLRSIFGSTRAGRRLPGVDPRAIDSVCPSKVYQGRRLLVDPVRILRHSAPDRASPWSLNAAI
jgi:hypothetical protein